MFTQCLEDMTVNCAERVKLTCELSKPRLSVQWKKDGQQLYIDNDRVTADCNGRLHQLVIKHADLDDAGEYTAVYNHLFTTATLTVLSKSISSSALLLTLRPILLHFRTSYTLKNKAQNVQKFKKDFALRQ